MAYQDQVAQPCLAALSLLGSHMLEADRSQALQ